MMFFIPPAILAIEDEDDRSFMENLYRSYYRLMYHEITLHFSIKFRLIRQRENQRITCYTFGGDSHDVVLSMPRIGTHAFSSIPISLSVSKAGS